MFRARHGQPSGVGYLASDSVSVPCLLLDKFPGVIAAGSVNNTPASPGPGGLRVVNDPGNRVSINNSLIINGGASSWGNPGLWWNTLYPRALGRVLLATFDTQAASGRGAIGFDADTSTSLTHGIGFDTSGKFDIWEGTSGLQFGNYATLTRYKVAMMLRASGYFAFVKGGAFTDWTLVYVTSRDTTANLYAAVANYSMKINMIEARVPVSKSWIPHPVASDSFNRANGALGLTDGAGNAEANGGGGLAWVDQVGTWGVNTNKAACSALAGGKGIATVDCGVSDVCCEFSFTVSSAEVGIVLRFTDINNYVRVERDAPGVSIYQTVGGVDYLLTGNTPTSSPIQVGIRGNAIWVKSGSTAVGYNATIDPSLTGTKHGLYTTNINNRLDNISFWPAVDNTQYFVLDQLLL